MTQEELVKDAVEEAKKQAAEAEEEAAEAGETSEEAAEEAEEETAETEQEETASEPEKKKLFGRKAKPDKRDEQIADLTDKLTRQMAEFDNFRKRTEREKSAMYDLGVKDIVEKLLPVIDNFERGFQTVEEADKDDAFVQGMDMIYKQLMTTLDGIGVKPIEAVGQEFDPNLHNAVMHEDNEEFGENTVSREFQKGYTYHDSVVRHSMVMVAN